MKFAALLAGGLLAVMATTAPAEAQHHRTHSSARLVVRIGNDHHRGWHRGWHHRRSHLVCRWHWRHHHRVRRCVRTWY